MQGQISPVVKANVSFVFDFIGARISSLTCVTYDSFA